jgi:hypothetical protein
MYDFDREIEAHGSPVEDVGEREPFSTQLVRAGARSSVLHIGSA